jgi:membrane-bound inhibitor of C-type lysozyme
MFQVYSLLLNQGKLLVSLMILTAFIVGCNNQNAQHEVSKELVKDEIIIDTITNSNGKVLIVERNRQKKTLSLKFDNELIELKIESISPELLASNDQFQFIKKEEEVLLKKNGNIIFEQKDDIIESSTKDKAGRVLEMRFNHQKSIVTVTLDGKKLVLDYQKPASGMWYQNEEYEFRGKGNDITLYKKDSIVFQTYEPEEETQEY